MFDVYVPIILDRQVQEYHTLYAVTVDGGPWSGLDVDRAISQLRDNDVLVAKPVIFISDDSPYWVNYQDFLDLPSTDNPVYMVKSPTRTFFSATTSYCNVIKQAFVAILDKPIDRNEVKLCQYQWSGGRGYR